MTKNNLIPKENYKQVEEVREIESEIPTYEEFLKNYQADQEVSKSYENELNSYSDIGINKGYGPCNWNNPHCNCYVSQGFIPLNSACPTSCGGKMAYNWTHLGACLASSNQNSGCRGNLIISRYAHIKCADCGEEGSWREWVFKCSSHYGYKYITDNRTFIVALNLASGMLSDDARTQEIIRELTMNLLTSR